MEVTQDNRANVSFNPLYSMDMESENDIEHLQVEQNYQSKLLVKRKKLGFVDKYLTVWILTAMVIGVLIGYLSPNSADVINSWSTGSVNWPIAIGLIIMMFPPLARVNYDQVGKLLNDHFFMRFNISLANGITNTVQEVTLLIKESDPLCGKKCVCHEAFNTNDKSSRFNNLLQFSLFLNWIVGPFFMFFLACACLPDNHIPYIRGLIMVGLARCIAMVIVWNDLSSGSSEYCTVLVCLNSLFQIVTYSPLAYFFISVLLPLFHLSNSSEEITVSFAIVAESVSIYLGIPFALGFTCWLTFTQLLADPKWKVWYKTVFIPRTSPLTLIALLFTIIVMFILKGHLIISIPLQVVRVAIPLVLYFCVMFIGVYYCCYRLGFGLEETITLSFTSASNNFELAIAASIAVFGLNSPEAFVGVIGPLVEVPVMLGFVHLAKILHVWWPTISHRSSQHIAGDNTPELSESPSMHPRNILFLCTGNRCRSHMAQAWAWYYYHDSKHITTYSAGTAPQPGHQEDIDPYASEAWRLAWFLMIPIF